MATTDDLVELQLPRRDETVRFQLSRDALSAIVVRENLLQPETEILQDGQWTDLRNVHDTPWLDALFENAENSHHAGDAESALAYLEKLLRFANETPDRESVANAMFMKGTIIACWGRWSDAADWLTRSLTYPSTSRAAAHHNLGCVLAQLRDPLGAVRHFEQARRDDPKLIATAVSWRNLSRVMLDEQAGTPPGFEPWKKQFDQETALLQSVGGDVIRNAIDPDRPFPSYHFLLTLPHQKYRPLLSSGLPENDAGLAAARRYLHLARKHLHASQFEFAIRMAERAAEQSHSLALEAGEIIELAKKRLDSLRRVDSCNKLDQLVRRFASQLAALTLENSDSARETIAMLVGYDEERKFFEEQLKERICRLVGERVESSKSPEERAHWLRILAVYETTQRVPSIEEAAARAENERLAQGFRNAVEAGDRDLAALAASKLLGTGVDAGDVDAIMKSWNGSSAATNGRICGLHESAAMLEHIRKGNYVAAVDLMRQQLADGEGDHIVQINAHMEAKRQLELAGKAILQNRWSAAAGALEGALRHEPRNRQALHLLLTLDILMADPPGDVAVRLYQNGRDAIRRIDAAHPQSPLVERVQRELPNSRFLEHMRRLKKTGGTNGCPRKPSDAEE